MVDQLPVGPPSGVPIGSVEGDAHRRRTEALEVGGAGPHVNVEAECAARGQPGQKLSVARPIEMPVQPRYFAPHEFP